MSSTFITSRSTSWSTDAGVADPHDLRPLGAEHLLAQPGVDQARRLGVVAEPLPRRLGPLERAPAQPLHDLARLVAAAARRRARAGRPSTPAAARWPPAGGPQPGRAADRPSTPHHPRQRRALDQQRAGRHHEGDQHQQLALGRVLGQQEDRRERDHATHARPTRPASGSARAGTGPAGRIRGISRGTYVAGNTQTIRSTTTATSTASDTPDDLGQRQAAVVDAGEDACAAAARSAGTPRPRAAAAPPPRRCARRSGSGRSGPSATCARAAGRPPPRRARPDAPTSSAGRYASHGVSSDTTPSMTGSAIRGRILATQPADDQPDQQAAARRQRRTARRRSSTPTGAGERHPQADQRRRVVDQALALEDGDHPPRHADPAGHRRRGDGVGGAHHRPERERRRRAATGSSHQVSSPMPRVVNTTRPTESSAIGRLLRWKSTSEVRIAAE